MRCSSWRCTWLWTLRRCCDLSVCPGSSCLSNCPLKEVDQGWPQIIEAYPRVEVWCCCARTDGTVETPGIMSQVWQYEVITWWCARQDTWSLPELAGSMHCCLLLWGFWFDTVDVWNSTETPGTVTQMLDGVRTWKLSNILCCNSWQWKFPWSSVQALENMLKLSITLLLARQQLGHT